MMTRTPDETKKGLNDPIPVHFHIGDPEPRLTPLMMVDLEELHADALALIQQLQDDNAQLNRCIENMTDKLNAMNGEVAKLQAERDAAVETVKQLKRCADCKHATIILDMTGVWVDCPKRDGRCSAKSLWEWRGVQKEE